MTIYIGADHRGFKLKTALIARLTKAGLSVVDVGGSGDPADDYPDFAAKVGEAISKNPTDRGILLCGSGVGVSIVANKYPNVRASLIFDPRQARDCRSDEDPNVLTLSADYTPEAEAIEIVDIWLATPFSGAERHVRRVGKIISLEQVRI